MEQENLRPDEDALMEQEERCRKALKTLRRAIYMRIAALGILAWALLSTGAEPIALGLMGLVMVITAAGALPLVQELRKQRRVLKAIVAQYD